MDKIIAIGLTIDRCYRVLYNHYSTVTLKLKLKKTLFFLAAIRHDYNQTHC